MLLFVPLGWAAPVNAQVQAGSATITQQGTTTTINASHNTIINYDSFNLTSNEHVQFVQPTSSSRILNRITNNQPTTINGTVTANGRVYFVNPAGVMFGAGAVINVGALYAAAAFVSNSEFLSGTNHFTNASGAVSNAGKITGTNVFLVGQQVSNMGSIIAPEGVVVLASGKDILIGQENGSVFVRVTDGMTPGTLSGTAVNQTGTISAAGGQVILGAADAYALAISHSGITTGKSILLQSGGTTRVSGKLDASSTNIGGTVTLLGAHIVLSGATVNASGKLGGGTVLIGGDRPGEYGHPLATTSSVDATSKVYADATTKGNGGLIVINSTENTTLSGHLYARGGSKGGDGGFIETSGSNLMTISDNDLIHTTAAAGKPGTWMIDPTNLTFDATGSTLPGCASGSGSVTCNPAVITTSLSNIIVMATNDITVNANSPIIMVGSLNLTMQAGNNINLYADVASRGGDLTLTANTANGGGLINILGGTDITLATAGPIGLPTASTGGTLTLTNVSSDGTTLIINTEGLTGAGDFLATSFSNMGTLNFASFQKGTVTGHLDATTLQISNPSSYAQSVTVGGVITLGTLTTSSGAYSIALNGGGTVTDAAIFSNSGGVAFNNSSDYTLTFVDGLTSTASTTLTQGSILTTGTNMTLGAVVMGSDTYLGTANPSGHAGALVTGDIAGMTGIENMTLDATGDVANNFNHGSITVASIGQSSAVPNSITFNEASTATVSGTSHAGSIYVNDATTSVTFAGAVVADDSVWAFNNGNAYSVIFSGNVTAQGVGQFFNTGGLFLGTSTSSAFVFRNGLGSVGSATVQGLIQTTGAVIAFINTLTLAGHTTLQTSSTTGDAGPLSFTDVSGLNGGENLTLIATGSSGFNHGTITLNSIGAGAHTLGTVTITQSGGMEVTGTLSAAHLTINDSTGSIALDGAVTLTGNLTALLNGVTNNAYAMVLKTNTSVGGTGTLNNKGGITFGSSSGTNTFVFTGGYTGSTSATTIQGLLQTSTSGMTLGAITLNSNTTLNSNGHGVTHGTVTANGYSFIKS